MARFNDSLFEIRSGRFFSEAIYSDKRCLVADVMQQGFFDECNRMRPRNQPIRVRDRIECDCADGVVVLRVMATDEHGLSIETRPMQEPFMFEGANAWEQADDGEPEQKRRGPGRPPKAAAAA